MSYSQRLATPNDRISLARLWRAFVEERVSADPTLIRRPDFDFERYVDYWLNKPLSFCFLLEHDRSPVGFLSIYLYDEAPPPEVAGELGAWENPFLPRRVGAVLGLYVEEPHRKPEAIALLVEAALEKGTEFQITDIDLLVSGEQTGIHALLGRSGFTRSAIQYTKHFSGTGENLPSLHSRSYRDSSIGSGHFGMLPLRDPLTNETVKNSRGETIYLEPLTDETGKPLQSSRGLPIYPLPLRDPDTQSWVFDREGKLVVCPLVRGEKGEAIESDGIPRFESPVYEYENGRLSLKRDAEGNYCFTDSRERA